MVEDQSGGQFGGGMGPGNAPGNWLDGQARAYSEWMLWVHLILCQCPGIIVGLLFLIGCTTPEGKAKGTKLLTFSGIGMAIGIGLRVLILLATYGR